MKYFLLFLSIFFLISCGDNGSGKKNKSDKISSDTNKIRSDHLDIISTVNIVQATTRDAKRFGFKDFNPTFYPVVVLKDSTQDTNRDYIANSKDKVLPITMITLYGKIISPITTILSEGVDEKLLRNAIDYKGSFYVNYLEDDNVILTKLAAAIIQILIEKKVPQFINLLSDYNEDDKTLENLLFAIVDKILEKKSSINIISILITKNFDSSYKIEKDISLYKYFDDYSLETYIFEDFYGDFFTLKDTGYVYVLYNITPGYELDLSEAFKKHPKRGLVFDYTGFTKDRMVGWSIYLSYDCNNYTFAKAGYSMNTFFIDSVYFQKFLKKYNSFCLRYDIFSATGSEYHSILKLK